MPIPAIVATIVGGVASAMAQKALFGGTETAETTASQGMTKDEFLRLYAELQAQDAVKNTQAVDKSLARLTAQAGGATAAQAAGLLGRTVVVNGSPVALGGGRSSQLGYTLPGGAASVRVQVLDASGRVVRTITGGQQGSGAHQIQFDGLDDEGRQLSAGNYTFRVAAADANGGVLSGVSTGAGRVTGFSVERGGLVLHTGSQRFPLSAVVGVLENGRRQA